MLKFSQFIIVCIFIGIVCVNAGTSGRRSYSTSNSRVNSGANSRYYNGYGSQEPQTPPPRALTPKEYLDDKSGFSTFGIISIIFGVIMACLLFYYGILCYPFLCRDEKKYRFMDVSSTITAATSRSMQSIEHYPVEKMEKSCV